MAGLAAQERAALCDLFDQVGPDAATLCEGWTTRDLAAHLVTRERRPTALAGLVLSGPAAAHTARLTARTAREHPYPALVALLRAGPPLGPMGLPGADDLANLHEFYVHREDVRRAGECGGRTFSPALQDALWVRLRLLAPRVLRGQGGLRFELVRPDGAVRHAGRGTSTVRLRGEPSELILYVLGRRAVADVELDGSPRARALLAGADLRL